MSIMRWAVFFLLSLCICCALISTIAWVGAEWSPFNIAWAGAGVGIIMQEWMIRPGIRLVRKAARLEPIGFAELRALSEAYDIVRVALVIRSPRPPD